MSATTIDQEQLLVEDILRFRHDPRGYVLYAFDWGCGELKGKTGPRQWQVDVLDDIGLRLAGGQGRSEAIREAVASGHGIGKSALVAWLILWAMSTEVDTKGVVTANTENQLKTKTWAELAKWHRLSINAHWFTYTATALMCADEAREKTWRVDMIPWSERNTEAFAGLHNEGRRILLVFDEASAIPDVIWEVSEGALTDENTEIIWCAFGNPTRNSGRFRECFGRLKHRWTHQQIDSRKVPGTNKAQLQAWVDDYGEDSDFVRVRVRGEFPAAGSTQFIAGDAVHRARERTPVPLPTDPVIMGVDVARFGDDQSIIVTRRGTDARSVPAKRFRNIDTMQLAGHVAEAIKANDPDMVFVDEGGLGAGVVDRLKQLGYQHIVQGVNFGAKSLDPQFANGATYMWGRMREWLEGEAAIEDHPDLEAELTGREYKFTAKNQIELERKQDMKKRGLSSPDWADGLALTFARPVGPRKGGVLENQPKTQNYNPFARLRR